MEKSKIVCCKVCPKSRYCMGSNEYSEHCKKDRNTCNIYQVNKRYTGLKIGELTDKDIEKMLDNQWGK